MAKKSKVGAVADSVSVEKVASYVDEVVANHNEATANNQGLEEETISQEFETITVPCCCPDTGEVINETVTLTPENIDWAKKFIVDFAKEYKEKPECPAAVLHNIMWNIRLDLLMDRDHTDMDAKKIVSDAHKLVNVGCSLLNNYSKFHDEANKTIKNIVRDHAPYLQNGLDKIQNNLLDNK